MRVNGLDVGHWRVYRIDVSAFWGWCVNVIDVFLDLAGLCERDRRFCNIGVSEKESETCSKKKCPIISRNIDPAKNEL